MRYILNKIWNILAVLIAKIFLLKYSRSVEENAKSILVIVPWLTFGGAEKVNLEILEALQTDGWDITIITTKQKRHEWKDKFRSVSDRIIHIENFPEKLQTYIITETVKKLNIDVTFISNSISGYLSCKHIHELCYTADLTHSEGGSEDQGGSPAFAAMFDEYIDSRIVISDRLKNLYINQYQIDPEKIEVIRNGVDIVEINNRIKDIELDSNIEAFISKGHIVTWAARMSPEKQPEKVVELARSMNDYNFILIGDGELFPSIQQQASYSNILLTGARDNEVVKKIISMSDLVILTSQFEGVPMVILESMALGKPVVTTNVGAISEIIDNGVDGYLLHSDDIVKEMPQMISEAFSNRNYLQESTVKKVKTKFNKKDMQSSYVNLFNELIN